MQKLMIAMLTIALAAISVLGQSQTAPTLRIVTEDPNLPSELYYGNTKVKPVRLRPGTNKPITIDDIDFFIQQQYIDFLGRMPDMIKVGGSQSPEQEAASKAAFTDAFVQRPEFVSRYGSVTDPAAYVNAL